MAEDSREQTGEWYPTRWPLETPSDPGGSRLEAHLQDRNNPHGVTAEQVGAVTEAQVRDLIASDGSLRPEEFEDLEMGTAKTTKNIYETVSRLIRRLKRAAVAVLASAAFSAFGQSVTGEDGKALYELDQEATVILDAPAVKGLLNKKQDALAFDAEPTENGANVVRGGGIWAWVRAQLEGYLPLSGGTLTGPLRTKGVTLGGDVVGTGWTLRMGYIESLGAPRTGNGLIRRADLPAYLLAGDNLTVDVDDGGKLTFSVASFPWGAVTGAPDFLTSESDPTVPAWAKAAAKPAYAYTEVGGLEQQLAAKAPAAHTHAQGDVEGLAAALAGKQDALTAGDNITIEGNVISAAGGASVPIDTTLPDEPTDDHVPSTKLVKDYLLNGKGLINYIYCGNGGFSFMGGESSANPGAQFDIASPTEGNDFFRMGDVSSEAGLIPVPTKAYVDGGFVKVAQDRMNPQEITGALKIAGVHFQGSGNVYTGGQLSEGGKWLQTIYQKKLTAGEGIAISGDNVISATGGGGAAAVDPEGGLEDGEDGLKIKLHPSETSLAFTSDTMGSGMYLKIDSNSLTRNENGELGVAAGQGLAVDSALGFHVKPATATALGGVKVGEGLAVAADGTLSATAQAIEVDDAFDVGSENPIQNKVVATWRNSVPSLTWNGAQASLLIPNGNYMLLFKDASSDGMTIGLNMAGGSPKAIDVPLASKAYVDAKVVEAGGGEVAWGDVTGKPSAFQPSAHTHAQGDVEGLAAALAGKQGTLTAGAGIVLSEDNVISAAGEGPGPVWVHPGDWTLEAVPLGDSVVSGEASGLSTNTYGQIFAVRSSTLTRGNAVSVRPVPLDALATGVLPEAFTFALVSGPATLEPEGNAATLTATGNGLAKVSATDGTRTRTVMTSFRSETRVTESAFYHGDVEGSARDAANDAVLAILQARDTSQTVASGITPAVATCDYLYATAGVAPTAYAAALPAAPALCAMVDTGVGQYGRRMFAVAPHYALTAAHWDPAPTGRVGRFLAPDGTVATVTATGGVRLRDWALRNGYTAEEAESVWDVYVFTVDGAIPDACVPWVIDQEGINAHYKGSLKGIACLTVTQNGYLSYTAYADHKGSAWGRPGALRPEDLAEGALDCRDDVAQLLSDSRAAQVYGGDSGLPVFFVHDGKPVVTSLYHTVCAGSSLVGGADILDHYIRAASGGTESLKRIPIPETTEETTP